MFQEGENAIAPMYMYVRACGTFMRDIRYILVDFATLRPTFVSVAACDELGNVI